MKDNENLKYALDMAKWTIGCVVLSACVAQGVSYYEGNTQSSTMAKASLKLAKDLQVHQNECSPQMQVDMALLKKLVKARENNTILDGKSENKHFSKAFQQIFEGIHICATDEKELSAMFRAYTYNSNIYKQMNNSGLFLNYLGMKVYDEIMTYTKERTNSVGAHKIVAASDCLFKQAVSHQRGD